uniref:Piezo non-specific cation channel cap domain-containing protein n=1 Tax=Xiphophorus couchianus TaxID=32473 RepID=A0A3B5MN53_9TELE
MTYFSKCQKKKKVVKYGMGGMIVVLLICIVWFPLLFMSLVKSVAGVVNAPLDVSITITLAGFQPIFTMSAQQKQLHSVKEDDFMAVQWLERYFAEDLIIAELKGSSNSLWTISPPSRLNLIEMLGSKEKGEKGEDQEFLITVSWTVQRIGTSLPVLLQQTERQRRVLLLLCRMIPELIPRYIRAPSDSEATPVEQLVQYFVLCLIFSIVEKFCLYLWDELASFLNRSWGPHKIHPGATNGPQPTLWTLLLYALKPVEVLDPQSCTLKKLI